MNNVTQWDIQLSEGSAATCLGGIVGFAPAFSTVYLGIQQGNNIFKNRSTFAKVILKTR